MISYQNYEDVSELISELGFVRQPYLRESQELLEESEHFHNYMIEHYELFIHFLFECVQYRSYIDQHNQMQLRVLRDNNDDWISFQCREIIGSMIRGKCKKINELMRMLSECDIPPTIFQVDLVYK